ncbi:hypothetical protein GWK47_019772 [Chionoecetes opilio]|uniref:Uncharacterized protein n=1 Tax=Chionoecetes opilio TaxID=41210 RepID=A0A8J5BX27_CHIOP|nr:hypothetical protein GWK47_019772 [Chionoecetes opilio]
MVICPTAGRSQRPAGEPLSKSPAALRRTLPSGRRGFSCSLGKHQFSKFLPSTRRFGLMTSEPSEQPSPPLRRALSVVPDEQVTQIAWLHGKQSGDGHVILDVQRIQGASSSPFLSTPPWDNGLLAAFCIKGAGRAGPGASFLNRCRCGRPPLP